jgi:hypothetical protein
MKNLIFAISICIIFCDCNHENYTPDCVCSNLELVGDFGSQEGQIIFHSIQKYPYTYTIIPKNYFVGGVSSQYQLCTDSALLKQIESKQIKDSSQVVVTGVQGVRSGYCNIFTDRTVQYPNPRAIEAQTIIRVKTIDKK